MGFKHPPTHHPPQTFQTSFSHSRKLQFGMKDNQINLNNSTPILVKINSLGSGGGVEGFVNNISEQLPNTNFYDISKLTWNQNKTFTKLNTLDLSLVLDICCLYECKKKH